MSTPAPWSRDPSFFSSGPPPPFESASVEQIMRWGVLTCSPTTPIRSVARAMAANSIHCLAVKGDGGALEAMVSDISLAKAVAAGHADRVAQDAATPAVTIASSGAALDAAKSMAEHDVTHLLVVDESGEPIGVVSSLDVAAAVAWGC